jgi:hypothetical protein
VLDLSSTIMKRMAEGSAAVTVRRLPDGDAQPARIESREHDQLLIALPDESAAREFEAGALIEIQSEEAVYLGAVLHRHDLQVTIFVEHAVNRAALAEIEDAWREP